MQPSSTATPALIHSSLAGSPRSGWIVTILRSRVFQFAILGSAIFLAYPKTDDPGKVLVTQRELDALHASQAVRSHVVTLSPELAARVDQRAIEDEIFYREALRLGLDKGDNTIRQHLITKTLIFAEDLGGASRAPSENELRSYFEQSRARWVHGKKVHFIHVFAAHRDAILRLALEVDQAEARAPGHPPPLGDSFPASREVTSERAAVAAMFGDGFADAVFSQPAGAWQPPVESRFGWHLVKVLSVEPGRAMTYEEARPELVAAWTLERRHKAVAAFLKRAYPRYQLLVDGEQRPLPEPSGRLGQRSDPSAED